MRINAARARRGALCAAQAGPLGVAPAPGRAVARLAARMGLAALALAVPVFLAGAGPNFGPRAALAQSALPAPLNRRDAERLAKWQSIFSLSREQRAQRLVNRRAADDRLSRNSLADPACPVGREGEESPPDAYSPAP
ncbi:MAG: hypothetical protein H0S85_07685 [Desulfovibrionaceae bacterium]|nr:hypothetical protein [Desulfovibrionaceae bacterium]